MQILIFLLVVGISGLLIYGYVQAWRAVNSRCLAKYDFTPLNAWSVFFATVASICLQTGILMIREGGGIPAWPWTSEFLHSQAANGLVLALIGCLVTTGIFAWLLRRASFGAALVAAVLLAIAASFFVIIVLLLVLLLMCLLDRPKRRPYG